MKTASGYLKIAKIGSVPIFVHWSLPLGGVLVSMIGHVDPRQWIYYSIAYPVLVIIHEAGHAVVSWRLGLKVFAIELSGLGGMCRVQRPRTVRQGFLVFSAGLIAQIMLLLLTQAYIITFGIPKSVAGKAIVNTFILVNIIFFIMNVIPRTGVKGLKTDGYVLGRLLLHVFLGHRHPLPPLVASPAEQAPVFPPETSLLSKSGFRPRNFVHGIEVLNDRTTPFEFVVGTLSQNLGISRDEAILKAIEIHNTGGMLISTTSAQDGQKIANAIMEEARVAGHSFACRYVKAP